MKERGHSYACPEKILTSEAEIVEFIEALNWMHHGKPFKFAEIIQNMEAEHGLVSHPPSKM